MAKVIRPKSLSDHSPLWASLTWDDLERWAGSGSVSRGRTYQRQKRVEDLAAASDGRLLATVVGQRRYVVSVWMTGGKDEPIESKCTCPVGHNGCKHAVAAVAEYLERLGGKKPIPAADADDPRWQKLEDGDEGDEFDDEREFEELEEASQAVKATVAKASRRKRDDWDDKIRRHISAKSQEELADLVCSLTQRFSELHDEIRERIALGEGDVDRLIAEARKELRRVTSEEAWRNGWSGEGHTPDYSKLLHRLERLTELGHADAVARLGREIIELGMEQVGRSNDEGETAGELSRCLKVVFDAVAQSSLAPAEKLLFAVDATLQDDYDVIGEAADVVLDGTYPPADWSAVADDLADRLAPGEAKRRASDDGTGEWHRNYERDQISRWLATALDHAGRGDEVTALYEKEARTTGSYERLINHLIDRKRLDDAKRWAAEGIAKTAGKLSGIASNLANRLCEMGRSQKQWDVAAAHAAHEFFTQPSREKFNQLASAAEKAGCGEAVREIALRFLETGASPIRVTVNKKGEATVQTAKDWPLPMPEWLLPLFRPEHPSWQKSEPRLDVLIDMAIADKRPDDVLRWYDKMAVERKPSPYGGGWNSPDAYADRVADAVVKSHPERSLEVYRRRLEQSLQHTGSNAYETVATYLRKMKPVLKSLEREDEWKHSVADIQVRYRNRPRLMEVLDRLEGRPIISAVKKRR